MIDKTKLKCVRKWILRLDSDREYIYIYYIYNIKTICWTVIQILSNVCNLWAPILSSRYYYSLIFNFIIKPNQAKPKLFDETFQLKTVHRITLYLKYLQMEGSQWHVTCEWWTPNGSGCCLCEHFNFQRQQSCHLVTFNILPECWLGNGGEAGQPIISNILGQTLSIEQSVSQSVRQSEICIIGAL